MEIKIICILRFLSVLKFWIFFFSCVFVDKVVDFRKREIAERCFIYEIEAR